MYSSPDFDRASAVHPFGGGPVTCASCGCRLQPAASSDVAFVHFGSLGGRDARGCRVACVELTHDDSGRPVPGALPA
jgi:hypothetical protein